MANNKKQTYFNVQQVLVLDKIDADNSDISSDNLQTQIMMIYTYQTKLGLWAI